MAGRQLNGGGRSGRRATLDSAAVCSLRLFWRPEDCSWPVPNPRGITRCG